MQWVSKDTVSLYYGLKIMIWLESRILLTYHTNIDRVWWKSNAIIDWKGEWRNEWRNKGEWKAAIKWFIKENAKAITVESRRGVMY